VSRIIFLYYHVHKISYLHLKPSYLQLIQNSLNQIWNSSIKCMDVCGRLA